MADNTCVKAGNAYMPYHVPTVHCIQDEGKLHEMRPKKGCAERNINGVCFCICGVRVFLTRQYFHNCHDYIRPTNINKRNLGFKFEENKLIA